MLRAAAWIAASTMCAGIAVVTVFGLEWELWMLFTALVLCPFAAGLAVGLRALWGALAIAVVVLLGGWLGGTEDYDMDTRAIFVMFALFVLVMAASAVGVGAFVRWVARQATSQRASD